MRDQTHAFLHAECLRYIPDDSTNVHRYQDWKRTPSGIFPEQKKGWGGAREGRKRVSISLEGINELTVGKSGVGEGRYK